MQTLVPSSYISIRSITRSLTPLPDRHRLALTIQATTRRLDSAPNATNKAVSVTVTSTKDFTAGGVVKNRTDWQSSCAILASKVVSQESAEKSTGADMINFVSDQKTRELLPVEKLPKPLSITGRDPKHGSTLRVAYQGVSGAYSEAAAVKAYPECEAIPCDEFEAAFRSVELHLADRAVLPIENSLGGSIHRNYDLLLRHRLHIVGEIQQSFNHCLHADGIQDDPSNMTRFLILAREPMISCTDRPFKTSIVFAQEQGTSMLFKVLSAFDFRDIKLSKIESRPNRNRPIRLVDDVIGTAKHFEYMFYVDFEASMADERAQNALAEVQEFTSFLRVLGSYPMDMTTP
ncbi:hypothetical protein SSX86_000813 [Deinandra increscens subsp. villosa]|uniref:arogenate dehydratase n=1 Tax=Deinandra increscens subsp. villosa TaxID=3103831 RepID=A0AAP0DTV2_9ASTR